MTKRTLEEMASFHLPDAVCHPGKAEQELKAQTWRTAVGDGGRLTTQDQIPRDGNTYSEPLGPSTSINNQGTPHRHFPTGQSDGGSPLAEIPSSQICLGLCQLDKNQSTQLTPCHLPIKIYHY